MINALLVFYMAKLPWILPLKRTNYQFKRIKIGLGELSLPPPFIFICCLGLILYIFSCGVYISIQENVYPYHPDPDNPHLIYQEYTGKGACVSNIPHQYISEGIVAGAMIFLGFFALFLFDPSTKDPHDPDKTYNYQLFGNILLMLAFLIIQGMMKIKEC